MPSQQKPYLPLIKIIKKSYKEAWNNYPYMLKIGWFWTTILFVYEVTTVMLTPAQTAYRIPAILLNQAMINIGIASIAVAWHSMILKNERVTGYIHFSINQKVLGYWATLFALQAIPASPILLTLSLNTLTGQQTPEMLQFAKSLGMGLLLVCSVLTIALPAKALGWPGFPVIYIWNKVQTGNMAKVFFGTALCTFPFLIFCIIAIKMLPAYIALIAILLAGLFTKATYLSFLSFSFQTLFSDELEEEKNNNENKPNLRIIKNTNPLE